MRARLPAFLAGIALTLFLIIPLTVLARSDSPIANLPAVITIQQSVPLLADLDGTTVPITAEIDLQVSLSGPLTLTHAQSTPAFISTRNVATKTSVSDTIDQLDYEEIARHTNRYVGKVYEFVADVNYTRDQSTEIGVYIVDDDYDGFAYGIIFWPEDHVRILQGDTIAVVAELIGTEQWGDQVPAFRAIEITLLEEE